MTDKKLVVAIDGSDYSLPVIEKAIEYAGLHKASIILVYCHRKFPTLLGQPYRDREIVAILNEAEELVEPFFKKVVEAEVSAEKLLIEEPAGEQISHVAETEKSDLIIMGSRGLNNLAGLIVGSVTNRVLHTAPCSVLVVK